MTTSSTKRIRVLVVDDSALVRQAISDALGRDPEIEVVGTACDPYVAREKIAHVAPDVITLDLEMPRMDGLTFLKILMEHHPLPVVVISSLTQHGSQAAIDAVEAGAVDVLAKPDGTMSIGSLANKLSFHIKAAAAAAPRLQGRYLKDISVPDFNQQPNSDSRQIIVIGASTGGIEALRHIIPYLPDNLPPIAIVQHISAFFSRAVAQRLAERSRVRVREAGNNEPVYPGECVLAPGNSHLALEYHGDHYTTKLLTTPAIHHCRPAVDVLFRSVAGLAGSRALGVLLTGMGCDGALGMQSIHDAGGRTIAQDEASCVVYGMPRAALEIGAVDRVCSLESIPGEIIEAVLENTKQDQEENESP